MRERIIILGAGVMQGPAIRIAQELGIFTVAVDGSSTAPCVAMADQFEQIDLKDKEGIEAFARSLQRSGGLGGIMTAGTDFSATVAWVAEQLGLPGIPYEAALNASDKARMRACFQKAHLPSPAFTTIITENLFPKDLTQRHIEPSVRDAEEREPSKNSAPTFAPLRLCERYLEDKLPPFPLVIKPVDNMGGRGCRRVNTIEEFHEAAADALRFSRCGRAIAEAFMDGPEFSVDAIVYHGEISICGLADRHIFFPPYFIEMGHTMPTIIAPEQQAALLETFCAGVRALGLAEQGSVGAAKGDIKLTTQGPMIGEIAARLSGGYMSGWTYPYSSGVQPIRAAILAAMGRKPEGLAPLKNWTSAERAFISIPGTVKAICGVEAARSQPHVQDLFLRVAESDKVNFPQNNVSKCGNIISAAPDRTAAITAAATAARSILIRLDPADGETAAFLKSGGEFPPSAFNLSPELITALAQLPETIINPKDFAQRRKDAESHAPSANNSLSFASRTEGSTCLCEMSLENNLMLLPFPLFTESSLKDYAGRSVPESLQAVRELSGLILPEIPAENGKSSDNIGSFLGKSFWAALARGGYQGAVYYIDQLTVNS